MPLGWPARPEDLFVDESGEPVRIDKAFSWEYPLAVHGLMHNAITNAWRGDPYPIDTLLLFMANWGHASAPGLRARGRQPTLSHYPDFIVNYETSPGSGIGFLAGGRGKGGEKFLKGEPNPRQWETYAQNGCVYHHELPRSYQYNRNWNKGYLHWARAHGMTRYAEPILLNLYSEVLQRFRLAAQGKRPGRQPPERLRRRVETYFDPLPFCYEPLETRLTDTQRYPLNALTQRPMAMYHSWDSQNAWLRQIHSHNFLFMSPKVGVANGFEDGDWVWVESPHGRVRCMCRFSQAVEPGTVWTWNAIGKAAGAWGLAPDADESRKGFLLNHLIGEELPPNECGEHISNSDPVTGQAAWFDVRVRVFKAGPEEPKETSPQFEPMPRLPGQARRRPRWLQYVAGRFGI